MNLSFSGCGFLGIYHVGVAISFKQYAPHLLVDKISGASAGALAAVGLLCDLPLAEVTSEMLRVCKEARSHKLGAFSPKFNINTILLAGFEKHLPEDAHERVSGKVHISLTRVYDGKNVIVSHFNSREDLFQALLCACFIPVFSGLLPPRFHGVRYIDGAFSDNLPTIDENTVTVSPFSGENDICPRDKSSQLFHVHFSNTSIELSKKNLNRFTHILVPPKGEELAQLCQQGFQDGLRFLQRNNLISCNRCVSIQSSFIIQDTLPDTEDDGYDPECQDCTAHRKIASKGNMPETVVTVLQQAMDSANKGFLSWLFRFREYRLLENLKGYLPLNGVSEKGGEHHSKFHCHRGFAGQVAKLVRIIVPINIIRDMLLGQTEKSSATAPTTNSMRVQGKMLLENAGLTSLNFQKAIEGMNN